MELKYLKEAIQEELGSYFFTSENYQLDNSVIGDMCIFGVNRALENNKLNLLGFTKNPPFGFELAFMFENQNTFEMFWFHIGESLYESFLEEVMEEN